MKYAICIKYHLCTFNGISYIMFNEYPTSFVYLHKRLAAITTNENLYIQWLCVYRLSQEANEKQAR